MSIKKTWGGRFSKESNSMLNVFNSSLGFDFILYREDIFGSKVHALMLGRQGLISLEESQKIVSALDEIEEFISANDIQSALEEHEDIHMYIEHLLVEKIGDVGKKLHTGRSRNDQVALDLKMYSRNKSKEILDGISKLIEILDFLSSKHKSDKMPGYTHLQQAQPITLGLFFGAYSSMFKRDVLRLKNWHSIMNYCPLGAGAFAGSSLPLDRKFVATELGFTSFVENSIDAVSDRDYVIELNSVISICMMHLSRLSEDLIIWCTTEFNFVELDDAFATGSSLMPNKKNPDVIELIRGKSGRVFGNLIAILTVMKGMPLAYNKDMQEDKECLFDSIDTLLKCLNIISPFLESLKFNTKLMHQRSESGYMEATAVLEKLVLKGVPFREAHHIVGEWVLEAIQKKKSFSEIIAEKQMLN